MANNRNAVQCEFNGIKFPSLLERDVYIELLLLYGVNGFTIQHKVLVLPASYYYPARYWKIDFYIPSKNIYIEAKGRPEQDFKNVIRILGVMNPSVLERLVLVTRREQAVIHKAIPQIEVSKLSPLLRNMQ